MSEGSSDILFRDETDSEFAKVNTDIIADIPMFHMVGFTRVSKRLDFKPTIATNSELQLSQIKFK